MTRTNFSREISAAWNHQAKALNYAALGLISGVQWVLQMLCSGLDLLHAFFRQVPEQHISEVCEGRGYDAGELREF